MGLEKILKKFDLFGIQTHPISLNPHGLRANRTSPYAGYNPCQSNTISRIKINSLVIPVTDIYPGPFLTFQGPNAKFDIETHPHTNIYNYINNIKYLTYRKYYTLF
jgi:hypothetical protein